MRYLRGRLLRVGSSSGTCSDCLRIIIANSEPDEEEDATPEDEDLITKDYVTFYRVGFAHREPVVQVAPSQSWQKLVKAYMDRTQYWPDVWLEEERGGNRNITTEMS